MRSFVIGVIAVGILGLLISSAEARRCPPDSTESGPRCVDKYEASVWTIDPAEPNFTKSLKKLKRLARNGKATLTKLVNISGAMQVGAMTDDYGAGCPNAGNGCVDFFAVSIPGVTPSRFLTWFQAADVCRNAGKELPSNAQWHAAASGTPDGAPCIVNAAAPGLTGTVGCVSAAGAFDMVGNVWEWVGDWVPRSTSCGSWTLSDDFQCFAGADTTGEPGALIRGGGLFNGTSSGVFAVIGGAGQPSDEDDDVGFRCTR